MIVVYFEKKPTKFMHWYKAIKQQYGMDPLVTGFLAFLGWMKGPSKSWQE